MNFRRVWESILRWFRGMFARKNDPAPAPVPTPVPTPEPPPPPPPEPKREVLVCYWLSDGKYGDHSARVDSYTNAYHCWVKRGYESQADEDPKLWLPTMKSLARRARDKGKKIIVNLNWQDAKSPDPGIVIDALNSVWDGVAFIEVADEPNHWTAGELDQRCKQVKAKLDHRGLRQVPVGAVYDYSKPIPGTFANAEHQDFLGIEAYIDVAQQDEAIRLLPQKLAHRISFVPESKKLVIIGQAYGRNLDVNGEPNWTNFETLRKIQKLTWDSVKNDSRLLALEWFSFGRPSGTLQLKREGWVDLVPEHKRIASEIP